MTVLSNTSREEAPSAIFIDEFDAIALSRSGDLDEETRRALSTLLAEMDGLSSKSSPFVLV
ncbi:MAG: ATP-binding protein, partial [Candidatus Methanospirareceae archaeon]